MNTSGKIMNCEEYKEAIAADPTFADDGGHDVACAACARFKAAMLILNDSIVKALAIDVPELNMPELPHIGSAEDKVVSLADRRKPRFSMPAWVGIAATVTLAAFIGVQFLATDSISDQTLAEEILAHMDHEPWAMQVTDVAVSDERLVDIMAANHGTMDPEIGLVSYAQSCIINGKTVPHLVIQGRNGPITLLLMPEEMINMRVQLEGKGINGVILPVGDGSIAIVSDHDFDLEDIRERVVNAVEWSI